VNIQGALSGESGVASQFIGLHGIMTVCLVTGGAGFIGSHLVDGLLASRKRDRVLDNLSTGKPQNLRQAGDAVEFIRADLTDATAVRKAVEGVDTIFHQAALASVPRSVEDPLATHHACVTGTVVLLDEARRAGVRRVVYAASSSAYGNTEWTSKRETDLPNPLSPYAAAKLAAEQYCQAFYESYGLETVALRYFNVFGPRQDPNGAYAAVIPRFIARMLAGEPPVIYGDGKQSRDFTFVHNVVQANLAAATADGVGGRAFNAAMGRSYSLLELVDALNQILGTKFQPLFEPVRIGDVRDSLADVSSIQRELGFIPTIDFHEGLRITVDAMRRS
jgi:UDP-glucose 4-epimerase